MPRIVLISLARRGGMVHYHGALVNALSETVPVVSVTANSASSFSYSEKVIRLSIDTGRTAAGTLFNLFNPSIWYEMIKILRGTNADLFHITAPHEWNLVIGLLIKVLKKPIVFSMHDPEHHLGTPLYMRVSDNGMAVIADAIVAQSKLGLEQLMAKGFPKQKLFYIPLGMPFFSDQKSFKYVDQEKIILFFGRIEPYKGIDVLLKAFVQISDSLPEWKLIIAGNGDISGYLDYQKKPRIQIINKFIDDAEISSLMQRASLVVIPYVEATQSGVIPIAYAFARPVIATDVGSLKEMVMHEKTGLLIKPNNVDELARAINILASSPGLCQQMGQYAYKLSRTEWGWTTISARYLDMYSDVINNHHANDAKNA